MMSTCAVCHRNPQRYNSTVAECSHVDCPYRRVAWSERPNPASYNKGPWEKNIDEDPKPLDAPT